MTGAYAKWLVNYLGRNDVLYVQIDMDKLTEEVKYLKGDMVSQGGLRFVRALAYSAKKVANKTGSSPRRPPFLHTISFE